MDPLANPFSMGAGNPPPALTGRATELGQFWRLLGRLSAGKQNSSRRTVLPTPRSPGSYPAFIQAYGKGVWDEASGPTITLADVERAAPGVRARLDVEFFQTRFAKATSAEQRYMAAIASLGDGPQSSSAAAAQLGSTTSKQSVFRDGLIKKGLIYSPRYGEIDFTVPQFADYVRRCEPLMP